LKQLGQKNESMHIYTLFTNVGNTAVQFYHSPPFKSEFYSYTLCFLKVV